MTDHVRSDISNGVLTLTLNRPEKKNALDAGHVPGARRRHRRRRGTTPDVRCVLIQAEGDMFTAGNDLGDFAAANRGEPDAARSRRQSAARRAGSRDDPARGGRQRPRGRRRNDDAAALRSRVRVRRRPADDAVREPRADSGGGIQPDACRRGSAMRERSRCSCWARRWTRRRRSTGASPTRPVRARELRERARAAAEAVAARPASAVTLTKALMRDPAALAARMEVEGVHFAAQLKSADAREAFAAFAEKRAPQTIPFLNAASSASVTDAFTTVGIAAALRRAIGTESSRSARRRHLRGLRSERRRRLQRAEAEALLRRLLFLVLVLVGGSCRPWAWSIR